MTGTTEPPAHLVRLIWVGWWVTLLTVSDLYLVPPLLPNFLSRFDIGVSLGGWIAACYQFGAAAVTLLAGPLADRLGCRWVLVGSLSLFGLGEALSAFGSSFEMFLVGRALVGSGSAASSLALTTYIGTHVPYSARGKVMGWIGTAYFTGVSFSPWMVTQIADRTSLGVLLSLFATLAAIGVVHCFVSLEADGPAGPDRSSTPEGGHFRASRATYKQVIRNQGFWGLAIFQMLFSVGVVGMILFFGDWLLAVHGLETRERGLIFALGGIPTLAGSPLGGWVGDRIGNKPMLIGLTFALAGLVCVMPHLTGSLVAVVALFAMVGFAAAARYSAFHALTTRLVEAPLLGHLVALRNFLTYLSTAIGQVLMGWMYASSEASGYIRMGWLTTILLVISLPFLWKWVSDEPPTSEPRA
ncbi:MAG: hypothetical protein GHCLOJNM_01287 [bacterium]|nr:hypothetical protein [bacterium]